MSSSSPSEENQKASYGHLAIYLESNRERILQLWREAVDKDERLTIVSRLSRDEFEDNLSVLLSYLSSQLRQLGEFVAEGTAQEVQLAVTASDEQRAQELGATQEEVESGQTHGFHRWQEGYDLRQLMIEWSHLTHVIVRMLNEYEAAHPEVSQDVMAKSRLLCSEILGESSMHVVEEYHRLQQAEAQEIVNSLSQALREVTIWEKQRGRVLREAVHDLRGNLSAVQGATSLLDSMSDATTDPTLKQTMFGLLQRSTDTLYDMLSSLLDLARLEAGHEERQVSPFDAGQLMRELCTLNEPTATGKGLYLRGTGPEQLPMNGDALKVRRIVQNLLLNALKYTREGGVEVEWQTREPEGWLISVKDTGPGFEMPTEKRPLVQKILSKEENNDEAADVTQLSNLSPSEEPDTDVHSTGEGVGLAIVKRLCSLLDAQLEVASSPGAGTTFKISFPASYE